MQSSTIQVDPITLELVYEGFIAIVREMRANMVRTAYCSIIYEGQDFSCCIVDDKGQLAAKAPTDHPGHTFPVPWSVRAVLDRFGEDIHPGDVFLHNDPYTGGTHLNDVAMICPVFLEDRLFAFTVDRAHWGDVGGMTPGSISGQATEIYQEGVRMPPIRVCDGGRPNQAALDLIFANMRNMVERRGDFTAALVSCRQAIHKVEAMAAKYGAETLRACLAQYIVRSEARMRQLLSGVADGTYRYEAYVESTGHVLEPRLAVVTLTVRGDELTADFAGSSAQGMGPMNGGLAMPSAAVFVAVKGYLDPTSAVNDGVWRPLKVRAPEQSFINASLPAACGGNAEVRRTAETVMMGALAAAIPEGGTGDNVGTANHVYIGGSHANGRQFLFYEYPAGGTGAFKGGDGSNVVRCYVDGDFGSIDPIEFVENGCALVLERSEVRRDSAGAGRWRGGFGLHREVRVAADHALLSMLSDRNILGPHGVYGGETGATNRFTVRRNGEEIDPSPIPGKVSGFPLRRGDVVVMRTSGGGGYGDPLDRPAELVWRDVDDGYLSEEAARARYGVLLTAVGVNEVATRALRGDLRYQRVFVTLVPTDAPEFSGARRILSLARQVGERAGVAEGDVVELVNPRGAPLRAWAHLLDEAGDRAYPGPLGLGALMAAPGDRFWLRRLGAWAAPPVDA